MPVNADALLETLPAALRSRPLLLAFSGGNDSLALLLQLRLLSRAGKLGPLSVLHVDHGLQPNSGNWARQCETICRELAVPITIRSLQLTQIKTRGSSLEAMARQARYEVLSECLPKGGILVTAHHEDDQAETLLLNAMRGSGPRGLAAMPVLKPFADGWHWRPLLAHPRKALEEVVRGAGLPIIEDPSNRDTQFDRNFLRHKVIPILRQRWPHVSAALAQVARQAAETESLLGELARADWHQCRGSRPGTLSLTALDAFTVARRRNLLRYWLSEQGLPTPPRGRLQTLLSQLNARDDAQIRVEWPGAVVTRYRDDLYAFDKWPKPLPDFEQCWDMSTPAVLPDGRILEVKSAPPGRGLDPDKLAEVMQEGGGFITLRNRRAGDRIRPVGDRHHRSIKNLLQARQMPPWERDRLWYVEANGKLLQVGPDIFSHAFAAQLDQPGLWIVERRHD